MIGYDLTVNEDGTATGHEHDNANTTWEIENGNLKITWTHYDFAMSYPDNPITKDEEVHSIVLATLEDGGSTLKGVWDANDLHRS